MALRLQTSNSLAELANALCNDLQSTNIGVFQSNYLVTQTEGMNNWLKFYISTELGIAANNRFLKPNDIIQKVFQILGGKSIQTLSPENQCWLIYKLLAEDNFIKSYESVSSYYTADEPDKDLKRMALAEKVADLFDQYQIYRPDMITKWNQSANTGASAEWQEYLWVKAKQISGDSMPDKTTLVNFIINELKNPAKQASLKEQIPVVHIFGLSVTTAFHIQLFHEIGKYIDISFYLQNPVSSVYWFEDKSEKTVSFMKKKGYLKADETSMGNSLLTSWGKVIQNTFWLLFQYEDFLNAYEEITYIEPAGHKLLQIIQKDIFDNKSNDERDAVSLEMLLDGSITINSCYTPAREVEALYNYLVHLIDQQKEQLSPRDIVVMVSDIDVYTPYIKAIFNNAPYYFPYTIADENYTSNDSISGALSSVLSINNLDFKAEDILQLLDSGYIRNRFRLTDVSILRKVIDQANIRFGLDGSSEDESIYVSWKYGLQRIIYGICMSGADEYAIADESLYPLDLIEGSAASEVVRFCHFIEVLIDSILERAELRTITEWSAYVEKVLNNLIFDPTAELDEDYSVLLKHLEKYNVFNDQLTEKVSYEVFSHTFLQSIISETRSGSFATGGITFCTLIPLRSIPFKVVSLLGLNFDKFPRKENSLSFNLMENDRRKGDRNVKENDKHLFLETLLSAHEYFYISYIGQSVKDNTPIPPSALVDELLDYIQTQCALEISAQKVLLTKHTLHSFSEKYRKGSPVFYSYLEDIKVNSNEGAFKRKTPEPLILKTVTLDSLIGFFKNPYKGYHNKVLNIYYKEEDVLLSDTEMFEVDHLKKWVLKQDLLPLDESDLNALRIKLVKTGQLPLKNMADLVLLEIEAAVAPVRVLFNDCVADDVLRTYAIELEFNHPEIQLKGSINNIYGNKLVQTSWSSKDGKYLLEAYIKYLAARASGEPVELYFISSVKEKVFRSAVIEQSEAYSRLAGLLELYLEGHQKTLCYTPEFDIAPDDIAEMTLSNFSKKVDQKINNYMYPSNDPYMLNKYNEGFFEEESSLDDYKKHADLLLLPLPELFPEYYSKD